MQPTTVTYESDIKPQINSDLGGCKISWDGTNFWAQNGSSKKKLGSPVPALVANKAMTQSTIKENSASYTATGNGYVIITESSWNNYSVTFSVTKNGTAVNANSVDGVPERNRYIYSWIIPVIKGDSIVAKLSTNSLESVPLLAISMFAVIL